MNSSTPHSSSSTSALCLPSKIAFGRQIELRGVCVHNLKHVDLDIPLGQLVVLSGVSGSGKSSLAFDTIFAEGQRRYIESFSASARQYLERIERPNAERIAHVPPTIAMRTDASQRHVSSRSTVASLSEVDTGLKRLFSRAGQVICPDCKVEVRPRSPDDVVRFVEGLANGTRFQLCFIPPENEERSSAESWRQRGFTRAIIHGKTFSLDQLPTDSEKPGFWVIVDRLSAGKATSDRITESAETAFREGEGRCALLVAIDESHTNDPHARDSKMLTIDDRTWQLIRFSRHWECESCRTEFVPPEPRLFSPDFDDGCPSCKSSALSGDSVVPKDAACSVCRGTRLGPRALAVRIGDRNIADVLSLTAKDARMMTTEIRNSLGGDQQVFARIAFEEVDRRLTLLIDAGLGYLRLQRGAGTLSEGQVRRLMLAAAIGSRVTGTLCLIDEPSAGLTQIEIPLVIGMLRQLLQLGNSVIAVDHAPQIIRAADHVVDLGPGAGPLGGTLVFAGDPDGLVNVEASATGRAMRNDQNRRKSPKDVPLRAGLRGTTSAISEATSTCKNSSDWIEFSHVNHRNLSNKDFRFPLGRLCAVTGPGGSGKTALVMETVVPALQERLGQTPSTTFRGRFESMRGGESLVEVAVVDRSPLTRSSRSNVATWIDVFDDIREVFALTADAKQRGFGAQHFSFNAAQGGRCRACRGTGVLRHDMQFLPDVTLPCPECAGTRYRRDILDIKYRGRSIAEMLSMSAAEAMSFFRNHAKLHGRLQMLKQIGLEYLVLGQATDTLSGGEAQRLKIASRLTTGRGPTLIVCDEATTGLHPEDVSRLVACFSELIAIGHSVLVIDNIPDLLEAADYVFDLGESDR